MQNFSKAALIFTVALATNCFAFDDRPAKYESAAGTSEVSGIVSPNGSTQITIDGDSAKLLFERLTQAQETTHPANQGKYTYRWGEAVSCTQTKLEAIEGKRAASETYDCTASVERNGDSMKP